MKQLMFRGKAIDPRLAGAAVAVLVLILPLVISSGYFLRVINNIMLYGIIAISLNLVGGYGGLLAMGHACYVGIGAYATAITSTTLGWPFAASFLLSVTLATIYGFLTGALCLSRIKGDYLMIVTMGVSEITRIFFTNAVWLTGGPMGIPQVPPVKLFGFVFRTSRSYYYLFLLMLLATIYVVRSLVRTKFGRSVVAIRDDETAAKAMGIGTTWTKIIAFTISTFFAGAVGALMAHYTRFTGPMQFNLDEGLLYFQMIIIGGLGSIGGSLLGAAILVLLPEFLRGIYEYRLIIVGLIMVVMMILRPQGLLGAVGKEHRVVQLGLALRSMLGLKGGGRSGRAGGDGGASSAGSSGSGHAGASGSGSGNGGAS